MLTCVGTVKVPFTLKPRSISFGRISRESENVERTVRITRGDGDPLDLEVMPVTNENVTTTLREIEAGEVYELNVVAKPPWPNNSVRANIVLHTGVTESPTQTIRVYGMVAPRLAAMPSRLRVPAGLSKDIDLRAKLMWSGGEPGKILEATTSAPETSVRVDEKDGQQVLVMHVPAGFAPARGRAYITIKTDDAQAPMLRIPVIANTPRSTRATSATRRATTPRPRPADGPVPARPTPTPTPTPTTRPATAD